MTVATPAREAVALERPELASGPRPFDDRATLEEVILSAWEGLVVEGRCACPVCGGQMRPTGTGARCSSCCSELA